MNETVKMLPYRGVVGSEVRRLDFYPAFGLPAVETGILSFGSCNMKCPYCMRMDVFRNEDGSVIEAVETTWDEIFRLCDEAMALGRVVRLTGGDPVMFPTEAICIAHYVHERGGRVSMAHNGSSPVFVRNIASHLESVALDIKAPPDKAGPIMGLPPESAKRMYYQCFKTQDAAIEAGLIVEVRTPIFAETTLEDLRIIGNDIYSRPGRDRKFWTLRQYRVMAWCQDLLKAPSAENMLYLAQQMKTEYPDLMMGVRGSCASDGFQFLQEVA